LKESLAKLLNETQELKEENQELKKQQVQMITDFNTILSNFTKAIGLLTQLMEERLTELETLHEGQ
jgi:predicted  nucleic acid-binding Zn-ribbon protein